EERDDSGDQGRPADAVDRGDDRGGGGGVDPVAHLTTGLLRFPWPISRSSGGPAGAAGGRSRASRLSDGTSASGACCESCSALMYAAIAPRGGASVWDA